MKLYTDLVFTGQWDIFTTSVLVAEKLEVPHLKIVNVIERILERRKKYPPIADSTFSQKFIETTTINKQKREYKSYDMNKKAFMKLIMKIDKYEKAEIIQDMFIDAFENMLNILQEHSNTSWIESRNNWKIERLSETDKIKEFVEYATKQGNTKAKYYYSLFTNLTYKALELVNCETPIREILNRVWLAYLAELERQVQYELEKWMNEKLDYHEIYSNCKYRIIRYSEFIPSNVQIKLLWNNIDGESRTIR